MTATKLTTISSQLDYEGRFAGHHFTLLANPIPAYESLLRHLSPEGASLENLKLDATVLSSANISCHLPTVGTTVKFRIDRFEVSFSYLREETDVAKKTLATAWNALHAADPSVVLATHTLSARLYARFDADYESLMKGLLTAGVLSAAKGGAGIMISAGDDDVTGRRFGSVSMDFWGPSPGNNFAVLRANATFLAGKVPIEHAFDRFDAYVTESLLHLNLSLSKGS